MRILAFAVLIALGFHPHLAIGAGVKAGPFEIEFRSARSWGGGPSMNPLESHTHARYRLLHNGRAVSFSPDPGARGRRQWFAPDLLEAHFLHAKGRPVVLVCTETGTYLVNDEGGQPVVRHLHATPASRFQFLDSVAGQPGDLQALNMGPQAHAMGRDLGKAGTLMLLPELDGILDLGTLEFKPYNILKSHRWVANDPAFGGFSFDESPTGQARVWWPDLKQFALVRYTYTGDVRSFALEVVDLASDSAYIVPFDLNHTRLTALGDITPAWTAHYFKWSGNKLSLKKDQRPLPWVGSLNAAPTGSFHYDLQPVAPQMRPVFEKFLVDNFEASVVGAAQRPNEILLTIQNQSFRLIYDAAARSLALVPDFASPKALTIQIAERFNRELSLGKHQAMFTSFGPGGFSQ